MFGYLYIFRCFGGLFDIYYLIVESIIARNRNKNANIQTRMHMITARFLLLTIEDIIIDINNILNKESLNSKKSKVTVIIIVFIVSNMFFDSMILFDLLSYINVFLIVVGSFLEYFFE